MHKLYSGPNLRGFASSALRGFRCLSTATVQTAAKTSPTASPTPLEEYDARVLAGTLSDDPYQRKIIASLSSLHAALCNYKRPHVAIPTIEEISAAANQSAFSKIFSVFGTKPKIPSPPLDNAGNDNPLGVYLYGDVGCGKTMLMDLFYQTIPAHLPKKRIHFHQFMQFLHKRTHQLKMAHQQTTGTKSQDFDALPILAAEIAQNETVLCFDEFQVTDVADAMLLRRLLSTIMTKEYGVILFATSNRPPDDLYINGIQRQTFIPCINLIKERAKVIYLNSPTDYRKIAKPISSVYYCPKPGVSLHSKANLARAQQHADQWYEYFVSSGHKSNTAPPQPQTDFKLQIWGRDLQVPKSTPPYVAQFTFHELCEKPMAAGDYLTLASNFHSFIITDIPYLTINARDQIRRFITFLDAVYDAHGRIATTSAAPFKDLFVEPEDLAGDSPEELYLLKRAPSKAKLVELQKTQELIEKHGFDQSVAKKASKLNNVDEERFAFARALSRITQMSTREWVEFVQ